MNGRTQLEKLVAADLEPAKIKAITTTEQPLLIIAGPGSGKTRTTVERVIFLITEMAVSPSQILVATFTEKAAGELISRISARLLEQDLKVNIHEMYVGTLHSIFLRLLEENREYTRLKRNYRVMDDFEQNYFVYEHLRDFDAIQGLDSILANKAVWAKTNYLVRFINMLREELIKPHDLIQDSDIEIRALGEAAILYERLIEEENALDFSGIQSEMHRMLQAFPVVKEQLQERIAYLMIDEYQDTNTIQETILLDIAARHHRICVVGDDDQSLYRFRGASVRNILAFAQNFPQGECQSIRLETNYRSHPKIISFYNDWMKQIPGEWLGNDGREYRFAKNIRPVDRTFGEYDAVTKVSGIDGPESWYEEVYEFLQTLKRSEKIKDYNEVAFLFRSVTNESVKALSRFLEDKGIMVYSPRSGQFFEREEIRLMIGAILTVFPNWREYVALPNKFELQEWSYYEQCTWLFAETVKRDLQKHKTLLQFCIAQSKGFTPLQQSTTVTFSSLFYQLLQFPLFAEILDVDLNTGISDQRGAYNLSMLSQLLVRFEYLNGIDVFTPKTYVRHIKRLLNSYFRFLLSGGLSEYEGFEDYAPAGNVSFMTIHQSKGLEFPVVAVGSLNLNPRKSSSALEETLQTKYFPRGIYEPIDEIKHFDFWRLFYTAFSRAKNMLVLTGEEKSGHGSLPSKTFRPMYHSLKPWRDADLTQMPQESIQPVDMKSEYSFTSDILLFENCPLQYKFFKALEFSPVRYGTVLFGTLVHQTIEDIHKAALRGEEAKITSDQIETWFNINYQTLSKTLRTYMNKPQLTDALKQVQAYARRNERGWEHIREAEVDVSLVKEDFILKGKVDLVQGSNNTVEIIDFKTGKKLDVNNPEDRKTLDRYRRQLEIYAHLITERHGIQVSKMHLYYTHETEGIPTVSYEYREASVEKSIDGFSEVVGLIEDKNYDMSRITKTKKLCENCDMQFYCNHRA